MKVRTKLLTILFLISTISSLSFAQNESKCFIDENNLAIKGYDVVSYFTDYKAEEGNHKYSVTFDNATFYFVNEEHQKMFKKDPMKYLPQYGGYCAFAMAAKDMKVPSDPKTFKIVDGKLFLFFNDMWDGKKFNTIIPWNGDEANMKKQADSNWAKIM